MNTEVDIPETSTSDFAADSILFGQCDFGEESTLLPTLRSMVAVMSREVQKDREGWLVVGGGGYYAWSDNTQTRVSQARPGNSVQQQLR